MVPLLITRTVWLAEPAIEMAAVPPESWPLLRTVTLPAAASLAAMTAP
jgi:hypothetical protein